MLWKKNVYSHIAKAKPERLRAKMLEIVSYIFSNPMGEYAAMGTFTPGWAARLEDGKSIHASDLRIIKRLLRVVSTGARLVMREFARIKEVSEGDARPLRQLSIVQFTVTEPDVLRAQRPAIPQRGGNAPPDDVWCPVLGGAMRIWRWPLPVLPPTTIPLPVQLQIAPTLSGAACLRPLMSPAPKVKKKSRFPWSGLQWFSHRA